MAHNNTVIAQFMKLVPRHEFESLAKQHHRGRSFRKASRWDQFVALTFAQLAGRHSLRDIISSLSTQAHRLYHVGSRLLTKTTLSRINNDKPYQLYESLFGKLLQRSQSLTPSHKFRFKNPLYALDSSTIDLCLSVFPWAEFRSTKSGVKLHVGLNQQGMIPEFVQITEANVHDVNIARRLDLPAGSIVAMDRAYNDYGLYKSLTDKEISFVTRLKTNAKYRVVERRGVLFSKGLTSDQTIEFTGQLTAQKCPIPLRRIGYRDPETGKHYVFLTNNFSLAAKTIADIYKSRWEVELFFKWIKQNLKIKKFFGASKNAVMTQIWIAMCVYLLLSIIKFQSGLQASLQKIYRLLQTNLFDKRNLIELLRGDPVRPDDSEQKQLAWF